MTEWSSVQIVLPLLYKVAGATLIISSSLANENTIVFSEALSSLKHPFYIAFHPSRGLVALHLAPFVVTNTDFRLLQPSPRLVWRSWAGERETKGSSVAEKKGYSSEKVNCSQVLNLEAMIQPFARLGPSKACY